MKIVIIFIVISKLSKKRNIKNICIYLTKLGFCLRNLWIQIWKIKNFHFLPKMHSTWYIQRFILIWLSLNMYSKWAGVNFFVVGIYRGFKNGWMIVWHLIVWHLSIFTIFQKMTSAKYVHQKWYRGERTLGYLANNDLVLIYLKQIPTNMRILNVSKLTLIKLNNAIQRRNLLIEQLCL